MDEDGKYDGEQLKTALTEDEENHLTSPTFFPIRQSQVSNVKIYTPKMKCLDETVRLHGDFDSDRAQTLEIVFERCSKDENPNCEEDDDVVKNWLKGKHVIAIENNWVYRNNIYNQTRMTGEAHMMWYPVSHIVPTKHVRQFTVNDLEL